MSEGSERSGGSLRDRCEEEVIGLHQFFEDWFRGAVDLHGEGFSRVSDVLTEDFRMVDPGGAVVARSDLLTGLRRRHGSKPDDFAIRIANVSYRMLGRGLAAVTYEEWHEEGGERRGRISTAIFREQDGVPNGVEWLNVHETWLP